jgi:hypothetical protein
MSQVCSAVRFIEDSQHHCICIESDDGTPGMLAYYIFEVGPVALSYHCSILFSHLSPWFLPVHST